MKELERRMQNAAEAEEFERAAQIRDNLKILGEFANNFKQTNAELDNEKDIDIVAFYQGEIEVDLSIYMMRNGILLGHKNFSFANIDIEESLEDSVMNFLFSITQILTILFHN